MNFDFKTGMILCLLTLPILSVEAYASNSALSSERLKFYQAIRTGKPGVACNYTLPSSQDDVILVFPRRAAQPMLILIRDQAMLAAHSRQGPRIVGAIQFASAVQGSEFIRGLFHGPYRVTYGVFKLPVSVWKTPMTYYAVDTRQGQTVSGRLSRQGKFTMTKAYTYEYDGTPFRLPSLPSE